VHKLEEVEHLQFPFQRLRHPFDLLDILQLERRAVFH
jgi:hypothetical protein